MKKVFKFIVFIVLIIGIVSCGINNKYKSDFKPAKHNFLSVEIETLIQDSTLNVRALQIVKPQNSIVYATSKGEFGMLLPQATIKHLDSLKSKPFNNHKINLSNTTLKLNFRALAVTKKSVFGITIGSPALVYKLDANLETNKVVYQENNENTFYDSMAFWNELEGLAIGDPTDGCMSVIITRDGGNTWNKLLCDVIPKAKQGEAAFAASNTNIAIIGNKTWVATGGKVSRMLFSPDKGESWKVYETPIVQGLETTGIYSVDFYDELNGFAIGGDYTKPDENSANKITTKDGGKTWQLLARNQNPGYRSCVQYVPNKKGEQLVAIGFKGIDYSQDSGNTWEHLSDEAFYTIRFLNDSVAYAAGNRRIAKLIFR